MYHMSVHYIWVFTYGPNWATRNTPQNRLQWPLNDPIQNSIKIFHPKILILIYRLDYVQWSFQQFFNNTKYLKFYKLFYHLYTHIYVFRNLLLLCFVNKVNHLCVVRWCQHCWRKAAQINNLYVLVYWTFKL